MKKHILFEMILLFHICFAISFTAISQTKNIEKCFIYNSLNIGGKPVDRSFYFIISDVKTVNFKGNKYSSFVFSEDSSDVCGFIRYSTKKKCYFFLSKYYLEKKSNQCKSFRRPQKIFLFFNGKTKSLCYLGHIGSDLYITTIHKSDLFEMNIHSYYNPTHMREVVKIVFDNKQFPQLIEVKDPNLGKVVKAYPR